LYISIKNKKNRIKTFLYKIIVLRVVLGIGKN
jgi:hypothetical protein